MECFRPSADQPINLPVPNRLLRSLILLFLLLSGTVNQLCAQLCTGSLGDPVLKIDFGTGASNYPFTAPGYQLATNTCPNDGQYYITTFQPDCGRQWHNVRNDHTGGGAFLMVNASNNPGDFFLQTVTNLCPNTTYEFSAWALNVVNNAALIKPNLTFRVESTSGTILNQYSTGDIGVYAQPTWESFGFFFTTGPAVTTVVLRITNNAPGGNGNDLALDDIQFRPCGPSILTRALGGLDTVRVCEYDQSPITYQATLSAGFNNPAYQWQVSRDTARSWTDIPGATTTQFIRPLSTPGHYLYRLTVAETGSLGISNCRVASNVHLVDVYSKPVVSAGPDRTRQVGLNVVLLGSSDGAAGNLYQWTPPGFLSDAALLQPVASPPQTQSYTLQVTSKQGCIQTDQMMVRVVEKIYVPTGFTPNGDGKNDRWTIPNLDLTEGATVQVFDRAGQILFSSSSTNFSWDGTYKGVPLSSGVYVYLIRFQDGFVMKGQVVLIR